MTEGQEPIAEFTAQLNKIQSLAAGGFRITLDAPGSENARLALLFAKSSEASLLLNVTIEEVPIDSRYYSPAVPAE